MLSPEETRKVALLARLDLTDEELAVMTAQLGQIVEYVRQLDAVNTDGVDPVAHLLELTNVFADDELRPGLTREQALANAPKSDEACFRVPAVLGE